VRKVYDLDTYFATGEATVQPVILWGRDGKPLRERFTKTASEAAEYIKAVEPKPGHTIVLVLALGAYETYDLNRNGDGFNEFPYKPGFKPTCGCCQADGAWVTQEEVLPNHHKNFELHGKVYRHHCFPAGTPVILADRTRVEIENIQVGDLVETREGPKKVVQVMRRPYEGEGNKLTLKGAPEDLTGTSDHPVLIYRRDEIHCTHNYNRLSDTQHLRRLAACRKEISDPVWVPLKDVLPGDYLVFPKPKLGGVAVSPEFAALVGWVASEGYLGARGAIQFTFGSNNKADIASVTSCLQANGLNVGVLERPQYGLTMLSACSKELHQRLSDYIIGTKDEKTLTSKIFSWDEESLLTMLGAYIDGDGHVFRAGKNEGQMRIRSSSRQMLFVLSDVIRALGVWTVVNYDGAPGPLVSPTNGKVYQGNGSGVVAVSASQSPRITKYSRKHHARDGRQAPTLEHASSFLVRVEENEPLFLDETVFNLEVEDVHHYVAGEVVVHNCNKDPAKAVGDIFKSFWNPQMHRVELLLGLRNELAPDLAQRIEAGEFPAVSMGTRIKYDVCTICGHQAPTRAKYCDHLKYGMRQVTPSGLRAGALNPSPKFFDISFVAKPADQTGYMMKKVADEHPYIIRTSAELGEMLDTHEAKQAHLRKIADIDKVVRGIPVDHKISPLTEQEAVQIQKYQHMIQPAVRSMPEMDDATLKQLARFPLKDTIATLSAAGVILTTPEVVKIVVERLSPGTHLSEQVLDGIVAMQGHVLELFAEHPQLFDQLQDASFDNITAKNVNPEIGEKAKRYLEKRSNFLPFLGRQLVHPRLRSHEPAWTDTLNVTDPSTGQRYVTTRGVARDMADATTKADLAKIVGGGALLAGAAKVLSGHAPPHFAPLIWGTAGLTGLSMLRPKGAPTVLTDEGYPIPLTTEFSKVSNTQYPNFAGTVLPVVGSAALVSALSNDYESRLRRGEADDPYAPFHEKALNTMGRLYHQSPMFGFLANLAAYGGLRSAFNKFSNYLGSIADSTPSDGVTPPTVNLEKVAVKLGMLFV